MMQEKLSAAASELLLKARLSGQTLATAESCTGGAIAHQITLISGASTSFRGGVVSYSNEAKMKLLHVSPVTLQMHGAVSEPVAREMVMGAATALQASYAVATSGIAGPDGGTPAKPVGTVCFGFCKYGEWTLAETLHFEGGREMIIEQATLHALTRLRSLIR